MTEANHHNLSFTVPFPRSPLLKAIDVQHADLLMHVGRVRLHSLQYYREIEDQAPVPYSSPAGSEHGEE